MNGVVQFGDKIEDSSGAPVFHINFKFRSFHVVVRTRTAKKCTRVRGVQSNLLFLLIKPIVVSSVLVAVVVVVVIRDFKTLSNAPRKNNSDLCQRTRSNNLTPRRYSLLSQIPTFCRFEDVPREIEKTVYANFCGKKEVYYTYIHTYVHT